MVVDSFSKAILKKFRNVTYSFNSANFNIWKNWYLKNNFSIVEINPEK